MNAHSTPGRDALMRKIMASNNLLNQLREHPVVPPGEEDFKQLMPHLSEIFVDLANYIFFAPPSANVSVANLVDYLNLQQEQTLDIWRFEAYRYLIDHMR